MTLGCLVVEVCWELASLITIVVRATGFNFAPFHRPTALSMLSPLCSPILLSALMGRRFTPFPCAN